MNCLAIALTDGHANINFLLCASQIEIKPFFNGLKQQMILHGRPSFYQQLISFTLACFVWFTNYNSSNFIILQSRLLSVTIYYLQNFWKNKCCHILYVFQLRPSFLGETLMPGCRYWHRYHVQLIDTRRTVQDK